MAENVPPGAALLLNFIGKSETGKRGAEAYDVVVFNQQHKLSKPLTEFTVDELLASQRLWAKNGWSIKGKKRRGSAAGKFQIIRPTLLGLVERLGIPGSAKFSPQLQDRLGMALLNGRGWQAFTSGQVTVGAFALALAKEWASMPVLSTTPGANRIVQRGESYYAGDGVNASQRDASELEAILAAVRGQPAQETGKPAPAPTAPPKPVTPPQRPASEANGWIGALITIGLIISGSIIAAWDWLVSIIERIF